MRLTVDRQYLYMYNKIIKSNQCNVRSAHSGTFCHLTHEKELWQRTKIYVTLSEMEEHMEQVVRKGDIIIMPSMEKKLYTVKDIHKLPTGQRAELYDGEMVMLAAPTMTHQAALMWLSNAIFQQIKSKGGACRVFPAPFAVYIKNDDKNYVEPDITVVCDKDKLHEDGCHGAPDWVVEVVSPSSEKWDYDKKLAIYTDAGVREYWIVDAAKKIVVVYQLEQGRVPIIYHFKDKVRVGIYKEFTIDLTELGEYLSK